MRNKRFVPARLIKDAYRQEGDTPSFDREISLEDENRLEDLPDEIFEIVGRLVSFVEVSDKIEGDKDEDK